MADIELVIKIPEERYKEIQEEQWLPNRLLIEKAIANGTPLDKVIEDIKAEIMDFEEELFHRPNTDYTDYAAVRHSVAIIDKYRKEQE